MSAKEVIDVLLAVLEILASWPLVILYITLIFRKHIASIIPIMAPRIKKISIAGSSVELESPELTSLVMSNASEIPTDVPDDPLSEEDLEDEQIDEDNFLGQTGESESLEEELGKLRK